VWLLKSMSERVSELERPPQDEDFSFMLWRRIFQMVVENERKALDDGKSVQFELEVVQRTAHSGVSTLQIKVVCEPGKPARPLSIQTL
jgi:hypothetical protein